jgi:hypothetical protein
VPLRSFILLTPLVFLVHDAEEVATVAAWTRAHRDVIPAFARGLLPIHTGQFAAAVALLFAVFLAVSLLAARERTPGTATKVWLLLLAALFANALTHAAQAVYVGGYVPGLATALGVVVPFAVLAGRRALADGVATGRAIVPLVGAGLLLQAPAVVLALLFGRAAG